MTKPIALTHLYSFLFFNDGRCRTYATNDSIDNSGQSTISAWLQVGSNLSMRRLTHYSLRSLVVGWFAAVLIGSLLACGGDSTTTPPGSAHLYSATGNEVFQLALPLKSTSTPTVTVTSASINNASAVAVDANGNVAVGDASGNITILNAPITNSSTPSATFKNGTATSVAHLTFNSAGDLFATTFSNTVNVFTHP